MPGLRVVHLTTVHHPLDPRIFHKQVQGLRTAGFDAHLVACQKADGVVDGVPVTALPKVQGRYRRIGLLRHAYQAALGLSAALYHLHDPELIPVGYALQRATGARIIYDMHEDYRGHGAIEGRLIRALERWCFRWVDHVVIANASQRKIVRHAPVTYIGNYFKPPDTPPPRPKLALPDEARLLYSGVMADLRGLPALLDLAGAFRQAGRHWRLDLVGVCYLQADRRRAEARIAAEGLDAVLHRKGWDQYVPWTEMVPYYEAAHVGLALWQPNRNHLHKVPTKFYEYLHYGLPIVCSDFPAWRAFIEAHGCGAVVPAGDAQAAQAVLAQWAAEPAVYAGLAAAARAAAPQYQWAAMEARLVSLYEQLLA